MLPQFELQVKRRMYAKRRRNERQRRVVIVIIATSGVLLLLICFNMYYIFRNKPDAGGDFVAGERGRKYSRLFRRRDTDTWISKDAQPFVSIILLSREVVTSLYNPYTAEKMTIDNGFSIGINLWEVDLLHLVNIPSYVYSVGRLRTHVLLSFFSGSRIKMNLPARRVT